MKKLWRVLLPLLLVLLVVLVGIVFMADKSFATGRCMKTENGACLLFLEGQSPIVMFDQTHGQTLFDDLTTGDEIRVLHSNAIAESYPAQMSVYLCRKLADGTAEDLPQDALASLANMGWVVVD